MALSLASRCTTPSRSGRVYFDLEARVAMLSYSNFGSTPDDRTITVRRAVEIVLQRGVDVGDIVNMTAICVLMAQRSEQADRK